MRTLFQLHKQKEMDEGRTISNGEIAKGAGISVQAYAQLRRGVPCAGSYCVSDMLKQKLSAYFGLKVGSIKWPTRDKLVN